MKKLLYITDQQEYADHGTIAPLFGHYLKKHLQIAIVYYTRYKDSFQYKGDDCIVPESELENIVGYLDKEGGRPRQLPLHPRAQPLRYSPHGACPPRPLRLQGRFSPLLSQDRNGLRRDDGQIQTRLFPALALKYKRSRERRLIEACDLFLPSSAMLAARLYPGLGLPTLPLPAGIDPAHVATLATLIRCDDAQLSKVREQGHNRLLGAGRSYDIMAEQLHRRLITL